MAAAAAAMAVSVPTAAVYDPAAAAARLRELAECTGAVVLRGYLGGGGCSVGAGEAVERAVFLARMAGLPCHPPRPESLNPKL